MNDLPKSPRVREIEQRIEAAKQQLVLLQDKKTSAVHRLADQLADGLQPGLRPQPDFSTAIDAQQLVIARFEAELKGAINAEILDRAEKFLIARNEHRQEQRRIDSEIKALQQQIRDLEPQRTIHETSAFTADLSSLNVEKRALGIGSGKLTNPELSSRFDALRNKYADK